MAKNKEARWNEFGSFTNVIQPETDEVAGRDHPLKGLWNYSIFKNNNPLILELGCGKGEYTTGLAAIFPGNNYIGVDIKGARMWRGAKTSNELEMKNVAFLRTRIEFISSFFSSGEVDEIWITFPDPHTGARNANKRLTSPLFLKRYLSFLKNDGIIHLKTDNTELFNYTASVIKNHNLELLFSTNDLYNPQLINDPGLSQGKPLSELSVLNREFVENILSIKTHYEKLFLIKEMKINYLSFRMKDNNLLDNGTDKK